MGTILDIDATAFAASFAKTPFAVKHSLAENPLLSVESIAELADELPSDFVEHNKGDIPTVVGDAAVERVEASPGEIARNVEKNRTWMVLKNIEQVPRFRQLLDDCLDEVAPLVENREGGMNLREGYVFLSAPNSKTPAHTDHEHNFLLQVRGTKGMNIGRFRDVLAEQLQVERMFSGQRNMEQMPDDPTLYDLHPGDGVYVPPNAPHWVDNGPDVSVSLSITFRTPVTERGAVVHSVNRRLRKLRISPRPPGQHLGTDKAKFALHRGFQTLNRR